MKYIDIFIDLLGLCWHFYTTLDWFYLSPGRVIYSLSPPRLFDCPAPVLSAPCQRQLDARPSARCCAAAAAFPLSFSFLSYSGKWQVAVGHVAHTVGPLPGTTGCALCLLAPAALPAADAAAALQLVCAA